MEQTGYENKMIEVSITEYYHALVQHDWYSSWSSDLEVYWAGEVSYESLRQVALSNGPPFAWLMAEYKKRYFSGKAWGCESLPMLTAPERPAVSAMIDLRADYECLEFAPAEGTTEESIMERAYNMGALAYPGSEVPSLIHGVAPLRGAWTKGQHEAVELFKSLKPAGVMVRLLAAQKLACERGRAEAAIQVDCDYETPFPVDS